MTVTQDDPGRGVFSPTGGFRYFGGVVHTFEGTAALRAMTFVPETRGRRPWDPEMMLTIAVDDGFAAPVVDATTSVVNCHGLSRRDRER